MHKILFYNKFIKCLYMFRCFIVSLLNASTCFEHCVLIIRRLKLYYTASGIITSIGGRPVYRTVTYMCDDTRCCIIQF